MKSMRSSTMSAPPATASLISSRASATVGAITLVVSAHESPLKWAWGSARVAIPPALLPALILEERLTLVALEARVVVGVGAVSPVEKAEKAAAAI